MRAPAIALAALLAACSNDPAPPAKADPPPAVARTPVEVKKLPDGAADPVAWVRDGAATARREGKKPLVYVGAEWCEPCKRFKEAAGKGELDAELAGLVLLELDHDRDEAALEAMGCRSKMIPLLAVPDAAPGNEGRCTDRRLAGAIKGEGAVAWMTPKVKALLE